MIFVSNRSKGKHMFQIGSADLLLRSNTTQLNLVLIVSSKDGPHALIKFTIEWVSHPLAIFCHSLYLIERFGFLIFDSDLWFVKVDFNCLFTSTIFSCVRGVVVGDENFSWNSTMTEYLCCHGIHIIRGFSSAYSMKLGIGYLKISS